MIAIPMNRRIFLGATSASFLFMGQTGAFADEGYDLITSDDMRERRTATTRSIKKLKSDGPRIVVHAPQAFTLASPVNFDVEFQPKDGIQPNIKTLKIDYSLGILWKDVTHRLMAHAKVSGTRLRSNNARLPKGRHVLRMSIQDRQGRTTQQILEIKVV